MEGVPQSSSVPLVSIGIPTYNGAPYLREALDSVLAQDYTNIEIILSDDASTDSTPDICRHYAGMHRRIRYRRNPRNLGGVRNFARVLAEATGTYFTWLAQDDILSSAEYVRLIVDFMERHSDVVLCAGPMNVLDYEEPGSSTLCTFPELSPERSWRESRLGFFRWPLTNTFFEFYGVYRREALARVPIVETRHRGRPVAVHFEYDILTPLTAYGRIVSLAEAPRSYRCHEGSAGASLRDEYSDFDKAVLGLRTKARILRIALRFPAPLTERGELVCVALKNFLTHTFVWPSDYAAERTRLEAEAATLRRVAEERRVLIDRLNSETDSRLRIIEQLQGRGVLGDRGRAADVAQAPGVTEERAAPTGGRPRTLGRPLVEKTRRAVRRLRFLFRPPAGDDKVRCMHLRREEIPRLRRLCEARLQTINRLHLEAEALLRRVEALQRQGSASAPLTARRR